MRSTGSEEEMKACAQVIASEVDVGRAPLVRSQAAATGREQRRGTLQRHTHALPLLPVLSPPTAP